MTDPSIPPYLLALVQDEAKAMQIVLASEGRHASLVIAFVERDGLVISGKAFSTEMDRGALRAMLQLLDRQRAQLAELLDA